MTRLGNFLKPLAAFNLSKSPTFLGTFCKGVKIFHFLVKTFLDNFYKHLVIFSGHTVSNSHPSVIQSPYRRARDNIWVETKENSECPSGVGQFRKIYRICN